MTAAKGKLAIVEAQDAPAEVLAVQESIENIPIEALRTAPWNARKSFDAGELGELLVSIEEHGIQVPLLVRPLDPLERWAEGLRLFEIVAGERRYRCACTLKKKSAPCIVRELTDDQARQIALVDNLQRADLPPLEEADAYAELQSRLGTASAIAARVGKDVSYVARRLQLVSLAESPRQALAERLITIDHALLLARLGAGEQDVNLKWCLSPNAGVKEKLEAVIAERLKGRNANSRYRPCEPQSVLELKHHIETSVGRKLSRVPWDLDDATLLEGAPACNACPSNTKANDLLFGDLSIAAATCENGACFERKREAFVQIRFDAAARSGVKSLAAVRISFRATGVKPRWAKDWDGPSLTQIFKQGQWVEAKPKSCDHLRPGVAVDWSDDANRGYMGTGEKLRKPGLVLQVCVNAGCKVHRKEWEKPKPSNGQAYDPKAEEEERERRKQAAIAESKTRVAVASQAIEQIKKMPEAALRELVFAAVPSWRREVWEALLPGLTHLIKSASIDGKEFAQAVGVASIVNLEANEHSALNSGRSEFLASLKRLGYDGSKAWRLSEEANAKKAVPARGTGALPSSAGTAIPGVPAKPAGSPARARSAKKKPLLSPAAKKRIGPAQRQRAAQVKKGGRAC